MDQTITGLTEAEIRLAIFLAVLVTMAAIEWVLPRRQPRISKSLRWFTNLGMAVLGSLLLRLMAAFAVPLAAVASATFAAHNGIGVFNLVAMPDWLEFAAAVVVLDFAIYLQHVASHRLPVLWRLHRVHHADRDFDVTTAIRFHPIEIALSMLYKIVVVLLLGPAAIAVLVFEIALNAIAMFNHANIAVPERLDAGLRTLLVTPDMHRVHHSVYRREHDSNFGFNLSIWDRLLGTYTAAPRDGHQAMTIGLPAYQDERPARLDWSLLLPLQPLQPRPSTRTVMAMARMDQPARRRMENLIDDRI